MLKPYLQLIRFDKPIGSLLLLWPTLWALFYSANGQPDIIITLVFCAGVFLTRSAGCAINDLLDIKFDKQVLRTNMRPLAAGMITKRLAVSIIIILCLIAFIMACVFLKSLTIYYSIPALVLFLTYPFMKRFFPLPQVYLGIAFSFGILMASVEYNGTITTAIWWLFIANLFWVLGYDTIYALVDIKDDYKIGIKTSAITFGSHVTKAIVSSYCAFILCLIIFGWLAHFNLIFFLVLIIVGVMVFQQYSLIKNQNPQNCFLAFNLNNKIGLTVFIAVLLNYLIVTN